MSNRTKPGIVQIPTISNELGNISIVEKINPFPFQIKRVYYIHGVSKGAVRGSHAHKNLNQLIIAVSGQFVVRLHDGVNEQKFSLDSPAKGLFVPPGYWRTLEEFTLGSAAMVLASAEYDETDYIRDYEEFLQWKK